MTNSVLLTHGLVGVKLGTALRGLDLSTHSLGSVLNVHQVNLDQPGLDKSHPTVGVASRSDVLHGKAPLAASLSAASLPYASCGEMSPAAISASVAWLLQTLWNKTGGPVAS